jgi:formate dehydrogenase major subunit
MVNITIDGKQFEVPEGTTVLRAAEAAGVHIPTLCDHKELTPYGGCRLCLVEVEGFRTLQPSCTLPVSPNMVISTATDKIREARKFVLTLIFSERNHFCPYCQVSGGDCELQNAAYGEGMTHWPLQPNWTPQEVDATHKYYVMDHNRCILCRRCVRACSELVGNFTLGFEERGAKSFLVADLGVPLGDSTCISCGTCVQVCPTGALIDRVSAYRGRETQVDQHLTVCVGCSVGCGIDVLTRDNQIVRIEGNWDAPVNGGVICKVGRFLPLDEERERLTTPLVRKNGKLVAATWQEALSVAANQLKPLAGKNGSGVAAMASTRLPAESLYLFKEIFSDYFKSDMVTSIEEGRTTAIPNAVAAQEGKPFEGKLETIDTADCIVAIGVNLVDNHEVAGFFAKRAAGNGVKLVIIDPSENPLDERADHVMKPAAGSDPEAIAGLMAAAAKLGMVSPVAFDIEKTLADAVEKTGIKAEDFLRTAHAIASAKKPVFIYGKGITAKNSDLALKALLDLARLTGALTDDYSAVLNTKGQANSVAAAQYGMDKPFEVNGHQAVYIALGDDVPSQRLIKRMEKAPFMVVQASYISQLTAMADVVLPVEMWAEQAGTYVNLEGRIQEAIKSIPAPEDVWSNEAVLNAIADQLGISVNGDKWMEALTAQPSAVNISA